MNVVPQFGTGQEDIMSVAVLAKTLAVWRLIGLVDAGGFLARAVDAGTSVEAEVEETEAEVAEVDTVVEVSPED